MLAQLIFCISLHPLTAKDCPAIYSIEQAHTRAHTRTLSFLSSTTPHLPILKMPGIHDRIREDLYNKERALWTALTSADPAPAVRKLCNEDANLMFPKMGIITLEDDEQFRDALKPPFHRFDGYQLDEVRTIIIDLMAGVVTCKIHAVRGHKQYKATSSTTWSQASDGEWRISCHQETLA